MSEGLGDGGAGGVSDKCGDAFHGVVTEKHEVVSEKNVKFCEKHTEASEKMR